MRLEQFIKKNFPNCYENYDYKKDKVYIIEQLKKMGIWFKEKILDKYDYKEINIYTKFIRELKKNQDYFYIALFDHIYKIYKLMFDNYTIHRETIHTSKVNLHYTIFISDFCNYRYNNVYIHEILNGYKKETIYLITGLINETHISYERN